MNCCHHNLVREQMGHHASSVETAPGGGGDLAVRGRPSPREISGLFTVAIETTENTNDFGGGRAF